jgi:hypothetical protein
MKFSLTFWQKSSNRGCEQPFAPPSISDQRTLPNLPNEIWRRIIAFTIRLAGSVSVELDDSFTPPYQYEEYPEVEPGLFEDRKALRQVCSSWRSVVTEISAEYLIIYSEKELEALVKLFGPQDRHTTNGKRLGEWTTRIDFRILGPYSVPHVIRLLGFTPNLLIYDIRNGPPLTRGECTPADVLNALAVNCSQLQRLGWSGAGETPRYQDLVQLCNRLPNLVTLRLASISFPVSSDSVPPMLILPNLRTLSLAVIPALETDLFMNYLSVQPYQLPALDFLECDNFQSMHFFQTHGHKIRLFRTTAYGIPNESLPLCSNLESFVISQGSEQINFPISHPSIKKICIIPSVEADVDVHQGVFEQIVMMRLDSILRSVEQIDAPYLIELRIRNIGAFGILDQPLPWLQSWQRRWNIRGIHFLDKSGVSFHEVYDCMFTFPVDIYLLTQGNISWRTYP